MRISIIIPAINEEKNIPLLAAGIQEALFDSQHIAEVILVDGGSSDNTSTAALKAGWKVLESDRASRAVQMNLGARQASGAILYFIHADSKLPKNFDNSIMKAVQNKKESGCFRLKFDCTCRFLNFFAWFSKFKGLIFRGGDQSLFTTSNIFKKVGGYNEEMQLMEEYDFIRKIRKYAGFHVLTPHITTSARKYHQNGVFRLQFVFGVLHVMYELGFSQKALQSVYRRFVV